MPAKEPTATEQTKPQLPLGHKISELPHEINDFSGDAADPIHRISDSSPLLNTFYLIVEDKWEKAAAESWMKKHAPDVPWDNLTDVLPLNALVRQSVIIVLARKGTKRNPVKPAVPITGRNQEGYLVHQERDADDVAGEMGAYGPIYVQQFWDNSGKRFAGALDRSKLIDEIQRYAIPHVVKFKDAHEVRNGIKPNLLYLSTV